jgi:NitT/TauT family transport system substrate-binding protein
VLAVAPALSGTIRTVRDLKGRAVGVSTPGSATHQFLNFLLVTNSLSPEDVSVVSVGMSASSLAALDRGKVDAAVLIASAIYAFEARHPGIGSWPTPARPPEPARSFDQRCFRR